MSTSEALKDTGNDFFSPAQVAAVLHWDAQYIRHIARTEPSKLPFPVLVHKKRVQGPAGAFLSWWESIVQKKAAPVQEHRSGQR